MSLEVVMNQAKIKPAKMAKIQKLLDQMVTDAISKVGFELESDASLDLSLKADSGYESQITYRRINALQWALVQAILESDIGKKPKVPGPNKKKYPLFNLFPNKKATS